VGAHGDGEAHQDIRRISQRSRRVERQKCRQDRGTVWSSGAWVDDLHLIAFENRNIDELARVLAVVFFHDEQPGRRHLEHEAASRNRPGRSPYGEFVPVPPDTEVNSCTFDRWRHARQRAWIERQWTLEQERMCRLRR
jgi:hypothetical protein